MKSSHGRIEDKVTRASVAQFIDGIKDPQVRADCKRIAAMMKKASGAKAEMWGPSSIGFGRWRYYGKDDARECLYVKRLGDLHEPTLAKLIAASLTKTKEMERGRS